MSLSDLEEAFKKAKAVYHADKTDKKAKKAFKKAKKALAAAKEGESNKKKRSSDDDVEESPKKKAKKMPSLDDLKAAAVAAKKAWKADKSNKELKKAWKAAKALAEKDDGNTGETPDLDTLKSAVKAARKVFKQDKSNKEAKLKLKAAKKALADAEAGTEENDSTPATPAEMSTPKKEVAQADTNVLSGLKKGGGFTPGKKLGADRDDEIPPNKKLFIRNLSYDIDDEKIKEFFKDAGELTDIYWMMDRESGDFKGYGFVTFATLEQAIKAKTEYNELPCMGRNIGISFSKPRADRGGRGGGGGGGGRVARPLSEKPEGCTTVFCGNLSYDVDDEKITAFLNAPGGIKQVRWLKDRESGEFKGAGFVEFNDPADIDDAVKMNGKDLLGRACRIDYAKPRPPREY